MSFTRHSVIRLLAAPRPDSTGHRAMGFAATPALGDRLDRIPRAVVVGFEAALESRDEHELARRLDLLDPALVGFGYEGATMAWTILDATAGGDRTTRLLQGPGRPHLFLAYIGIGFAMRRLPRPLWGRVLPDLDAPPYHPTLSWLAVDGYGFDLAYFRRSVWIGARRRPRPWAWLDRPDYFARAFDQGVGRALWFVEGADLDRVATTLRGFSGERHPDLWSGVGLAATFAGPTDDLPYADLLEHAGPHADHVRIGAVLAARARVSAGHVPDHTERALAALTGLGPAAAAALADDAACTVDTAAAPAYERWRQGVADRLAGTAPGRTEQHVMSSRREPVAPRR